MAQEQPKFLKLYQSVTSGTFMGRDDGYPITDFMIFYDIRTLALDFGKRRGEKYYSLTPMTPEQLEHHVKTELEAVEQEKQDEQRRTDEAEFERLRNKLGKE